MNSISSRMNISHPQSISTIISKDLDLYRFFSVIKDVNSIQSICQEKKIVTWLKEKHAQIEVNLDDELLRSGLNIKESTSKRKIEKRQTIAMIYAEILAKYIPDDSGELDLNFNYYELVTIVKGVFDKHLQKYPSLFSSGIKLNCSGQEFYVKVEKSKVCIFSNRAELISRGDYGVVYKIYEISSQQLFALKLSKPAKKNTSKAVSTARKNIRYLSSEISNLKYLHQLASTFSDGAKGLQAAPLFTFNQTSFYGYVGALYENELGVWAQGNHENVKRLVMAKSLMRAFETLTKLSCWHGDLKDRNVLVQGDGCVIIDFAGSMLFQEAFKNKVLPQFYSYTHTNKEDQMFCTDYILGKVNDKKGESIQNEKFIELAHAWDLYSVAMILFQILSSVKPFKEMDDHPWPITKNGICQEHKDILEKKGYSPEVIKVLTQMLNHDYKTRLSVKAAIEIWEKIA